MTDTTSGRLVDRLRSPFREFGAAAGTLYFIDRGLRAISPSLGLFVYEMMVQPIATKPLLGAGLSKNLSFGEIGPGHPDLDQMPARRDIIALRFEQGAVCLGAYRKGLLLGYIWLCFNQYEEDEVRCTYQLAEPDCSVFDFDLYVMPESRLGLGFPAVWQGANEYLSSRGIRYTFSRVTRFNLASRRSHAHFGWKRAARAMFLRLGPVEVMFADVFPYVAATLGPKGRARLSLKPDVLSRALG